MLYDLHKFFHESYGICVWILLTLVVALIMIVIGLIHWRNQRKRDKNFEGELKEKLEEIEKLQNPEEGEQPEPAAAAEE